MACSVNSLSAKEKAIIQKYIQNKARICEHCNQKGHSKERCYKIIRYPENWKFKESRTDNKKAGEGTSGNWRNKERKVNAAVIEDNPLEISVFANAAQSASFDQQTMDIMCQEVAKLLRESEASTSLAGPYH